MPNVPRISTPTPNFATSAMTFVPVMLSTVWIASRTSVMKRIVEWCAGFQFVPNQRWKRSVTYGTTPVSTDATVTSNAMP